MQKYKVTQVQMHVHVEGKRTFYIKKKLDNKIDHGIIEADDAVSAMYIVAYRTNVPVTCLEAEEIEESVQNYDEPELEDILYNDERRHR